MWGVRNIRANSICHLSWRPRRRISSGARAARANKSKSGFAGMQSQFFLRPWEKGKYLPCCLNVAVKWKKQGRINTKLEKKTDHRTSILESYCCWLHCSTLCLKQRKIALVFRWTQIIYLFEKPLYLHSASETKIHIIVSLISLKLHRNSFQGNVQVIMESGLIPHKIECPIRKIE